jgi:uncharacterized protein YdeI (YjbR/CyaY-like superfamily)
MKSPRSQLSLLDSRGRWWQTWSQGREEREDAGASSRDGRSASIMPNTNTFYAKDRISQRKWLVENHGAFTGVWLVYDKPASGMGTLTYDDIVEELLCFGWIDGTYRSLGESQSMLYVSPRRPGSTWAKSNKQRVERLLKENKMAEPGTLVVERSKQDGSWNALDEIESLIAPEDLVEALSKNKAAQESYDGFSNSSKKQILWYIASAKRTETRARRINQIVSEAEKNNNPLTYRKPKV